MITQALEWYVVNLIADPLPIVAVEAAIIAAFVSFIVWKAGR